MFINRKERSACWDERGVEKHMVFELSASTNTDSCGGYLRSLITKPAQIPYGQYAGVLRADGGFYCVRDPLGVAKLFYSLDGQGKLHFSSQYTDLLSGGFKVFSVPRGALVYLGDSGERHLIKQFKPASPVLKNNNEDVTAEFFRQSGTFKEFQALISRRLEAVFMMLRSWEDEGCPIFVALSGGLDSACIAHYAARYLQSPIACTLDLGGSEDARQAVKVAECLGIEHQVFSVNQEQVLEAVSLAPSLCQDFRDFNVHCAALNLLLGQHIKSWVDTNGLAGGSERIVLTGDLMNEYTCDYAEEVMDGQRYYRLPNINTDKLQRHLIGGLDTSDRELRPFAHFGLSCIQPYSVLHDIYEALPGRVFEGDKAKSLLNSGLVPESVLEHIPRQKLRAQVGDRESMGVLGLCHREKITEKDFKKALLGCNSTEKYQIPIIMGRYETEKFTSA